MEHKRFNERCMIDLTTDDRIIIVTIKNNRSYGLDKKFKKVTQKIFVM